MIIMKFLAYFTKGIGLISKREISKSLPQVKFIQETEK